MLASSIAMQSNGPESIKRVEIGVEWSGVLVGLFFSKCVMMFVELLY